MGYRTRPEYIPHIPAHQRHKNVMKKNEKNSLKCILTNARSIINKKEELEAVAFEKKTDLILIVESWAKDKHSMGEVSLFGYDCHRHDRTQTERGGGCIIYADSELKTVLLENLTNTPDTDSVW